MISDISLEHNKPLIIIDDENSDSDFRGNKIYWSSINILEGCISVPLLVEKYGHELKAEYIELISNLGESEINDISLGDALKNKEGFSFWWMTLLSEKSPWKSPEIFTVFKAIVLNKLLENYSGNKIIIKSNNKHLIDWVKSVKKDDPLKIEVLKVKAGKKGFHWKCLLPRPLLAFLFLLREIARFKGTIIGNKIPVVSGINNKKVNSIISYSCNLNSNTFRKGKINSNYWGPLNEILLSQGRFVQWLMIYIPTKDFPTFKSIINSRDDAFTDDNQSVLFVEEFLSFKVLVKSVSRYFDLVRLSYRYKPIISDKCNPLFFLINDWNDSFKGISAINSSLKYSLLEAAIGELPIINNDGQGIYLFENQAWERALVFLWKKRSKQKLIGFQHVSGKFYDLRPFDAYGSKAISLYKKAPIPDIVAVPGVAAEGDLVSFHYPKERVVVVESLRNLYLENVEKTSSNIQLNTLLVVTDYQSLETEQQIKLLVDSWDIVERNFSKVIVKPHPACEVEQIFKKYGLLNNSMIIIENRSLNFLWGSSDVVYASNVTGAALESAFIGLPTLVHLGGDTFNMSPLRGVNGVKFITKVSEFEKAVNEIETPKISYNFLCLDKRLSNWIDLLEINKD